MHICVLTIGTRFLTQQRRNYMVNYDVPTHQKAYKTLKTNKVFRINIDPKEYFKVRNELTKLKEERERAKYIEKLSEMDNLSEILIRWYREGQKQNIDTKRYMSDKVIDCLNLKHDNLLSQIEDRKSRISHLGYNEFNAYDMFNEDITKFNSKVVDVNKMIKEFE